MISVGGGGVGLWYTFSISVKSSQTNFLHSVDNQLLKRETFSRETHRQNSVRNQEFFSEMTAKTFAVILWFYLSLAYGQPFQTKTIEGNSGLYFEEAGKAFFYSHEWKIVSNVNLTEYRKELNNIRHVVDTIGNHCTELKFIEGEKNVSVKRSEGCGPALLKLNFVMADIEENDSQWLGNDTRAKRNILFGLATDHSTFYNEFANMSTHGMETSTSNDRQTSFIVSTLSSLRKVTENDPSIDAYVANQLSQVHTTLVAARNGSANAIRLFQLRATIPDIISYQLLILNNFASKQKQYMNIMSLVGTTNAPIPTILSTHILLPELNNIRSIVSEKGLGFPVQLTSKNVHFLFHLSYPKISLFKDQIFVTFKLPLISKLSGNYFTLFKVTSALYNLGGSIYSFVIPSHEVIAVDAHKERFVTLTVDDLNKCNQVGNETLCKQTSPSMSVRTSTECEIMILLKSQMPYSCNERYIRNYADIFIKVLQPNTWLVTMTKSSNVRYLCEGKDIYEKLTQINGLLTLDSDCKFFTDDVVISGDNIFPKRSVREHLIENLEKKEQVNETFELKFNGHFTSNDIAQVIGFGETEKLIRISYSKYYVRIMNSVTKRIAKVEINYRGVIIGGIIFFFVIEISYVFITLRNKRTTFRGNYEISTRLAARYPVTRTPASNPRTNTSVPTPRIEPSAPVLSTNISV